jgi:hypothetical protein
MVFIPCNALGGEFSWICAPLALPQGGLILVKPCPSGFMLHLVHFKPFIFRTQERVTCLHTSKKSSCLQFQEGWWKSAPEKSLATLCLCSLDHRRRPRKQDIEKKNESDADQLATDWWWWWCWFLQILGVLLLLVSLVMLDATGILYFSLATVLLTSFLLQAKKTFQLWLLLHSYMYAQITSWTYWQTRHKAKV